MMAKYLTMAVSCPKQPLMIGQRSLPVDRIQNRTARAKHAPPNYQGGTDSRRRLSEPDRAPAGASAGVTDKNGEPQRRHTTALMARPPHGGRLHRDAAAKPPRAAKRTQAHIALAATAAPADVAGSRRARMPPGGDLRERAHEFGAAHRARDPPAARPRSAGPARTCSSRARPTK